MLRFPSNTAEAPIPGAANSDANEVSSSSVSADESHLWPFLHRSRLAAAEGAYQVPHNFIASSVRRFMPAAASRREDLAQPISQKGEHELPTSDLVPGQCDEVKMTSVKTETELSSHPIQPAFAAVTQTNVENTAMQPRAEKAAPLPSGSYAVPWIVPLSELRFYQDYICGTFTNGRSLASTIEELRLGAITPETLPPIEALYHRGVWYGMGNRRLACFFMVYSASDPHRPIPVIASYIPEDEELLNQGDGKQVRVGTGMQTENGIIVDYRRPSLKT